MPSPGRPYINHPALPVGDPAANQPDPAKEPETPQTPPPETTSEPEPRLYAGKYKTPEELEAGYQNSFKELERLRGDYEQRIADERDRAERVIASLQPRTEPADPFAPLAELGIPPETIRAAVREEARRIAQEEASNAVRPITAGSQARSAVSGRYEDFAKVENDVATFIGGDRNLSQRYARMFGVDPEAAMEWAYMSYRTAHPAKVQRVSAADDQPGGQITSQRTTTERTKPDTSAADEARALQYARQFGDPSHYLRLKLKSVIPDSFFDTGR